MRSWMLPDLIGHGDDIILAVAECVEDGGVGVGEVAVGRAGVAEVGVAVEVGLHGDQGVDIERAPDPLDDSSRAEGGGAG